MKTKNSMKQARPLLIPRQKPKQQLGNEKSNKTVKPGDFLSMKTHTMDEILSNLGFWRNAPGCVCG